MLEADEGGDETKKPGPSSNELDHAYVQSVDSQ